MTRGPEPSAHVIPEAALPQWAALSAALKARGPAPCESSPVPEAWWPSPTERLTPWEAAAVEACGGCPARVECLAFAVAAGERAGIWGGLLPSQRAHGVTAA